MLGIKLKAAAMSLGAEPEIVNTLIVENEIALRRARRLVEFMRLVCKNEAQLLLAPVQTSESENASEAKLEKIKTSR